MGMPHTLTIENEGSSIRVMKELYAPRSYHKGVFDNGQNQFDVLLLNITEKRRIRRSGIIPVSDITDPDTQLQQSEIGRATMKVEKLVGFVQDTEGAREILAKGKFTEEKPSYKVKPDPIASLML